LGLEEEVQLITNRTESKISLPTYFISHGGGPWPWLRKEMPGVYDKLEQSLKEISREISVTPTAILAVSGIGKHGTSQ